MLVGGSLHIGQDLTDLIGAALIRGFQIPVLLAVHQQNGLCDFIQLSPADGVVVQALGETIEVQAGVRLFVISERRRRYVTGLELHHHPDCERRAVGHRLEDGSQLLKLYIACDVIFFDEG